MFSLSYVQLNTKLRLEDHANIMLNEVYGNGLHLSGKGEFALINNYLDKVCKNFEEVVKHPRMKMHWKTLA